MLVKPSQNASYGIMGGFKINRMCKNLEVGQGSLEGRC